MAVPKSESSGRPQGKASTANRANQAPSKKGADAKSDEAADDAKKQAWEDAKKAAHYAQLAAAHRRVPIIRGDADDRPPAPKAANTAPVGQRNKAESKADGVAHKRANPGPVAGLHNPITPYIDRVASTAKNPMTATGVTSPLDPFISGAANSPAMSPTATPTSAPRPAPSAPRPQTGGTPAGPGQVPFENGVDGRVADLWEIGQARLNGFAAEARQAASGAADWLWETGAGVARGVTSGEYTQAALQEYQARTREFANNPYQARKQANLDMLGGLGSAAWDIAQGGFWLGAQVVATGVEAVKLGGRIGNGVSYLVSGEYVFDIDSRTAWRQAHEMVSGYGGRWKQGVQTYSAEHWGMRTGQGGAEKSIFFSAGEVGGNIASVVAPPLAAASKAGVLARGTAAVASAEARGAVAVAGSLADDAAAAASRTGAAAGRGPSAVGALKTAGASVDDAAKAGQASGRGAPAILRETAVGGTSVDAAARVGQGAPHASASAAKAVDKVAGASRSAAAGGTVTSARRNGFAWFKDSVEGLYNSIAKSNDDLARSITTAKNKLRNIEGVTEEALARTDQPGLFRRAIRYVKDLGHSSATPNREAGFVRRALTYVDDIAETMSGIRREIKRAAVLKIDNFTHPRLFAANQYFDNLSGGFRALVRGTAQDAKEILESMPVIGKLSRALGHQVVRVTGHAAKTISVVIDSIKAASHKMGEALSRLRSVADQLMSKPAVRFVAKKIEPAARTAVRGTKAVFKAADTGLNALRWASWNTAKGIPPYLGFEWLRGNVEIRSDEDALRRANLSTNPDHAAGVRIITLGTTADAFISASVSAFGSGPTVKGVNPGAALRGEWGDVIEVQEAVATAFVRRGPDGPQSAWNKSARASAGIVGVGWAIGPYVANINGNAHIAFASLGGSARVEAGSINEGQGTSAGIRTYGATSLWWRFAYEANFDYPWLNLPGGFFDGRVVFDAWRGLIGGVEDYWVAGGIDPFFDVVATANSSAPHLTGVAKKQNGDLITHYLGRSLVPEGGIVRGGSVRTKNGNYYEKTFGRNPTGKKAAEQLRAEHPGAYAREWPWGGRMFKQVEQFDPNDPTLPQILGAGGRDPRTQADRVEEQLDRAEQTPGPTAPWQGPVRQPRTQADRVEDRLREAEQVRGPNPPARQIALEPPPVVNPGIAGQFVVSPRQGANVRSAPGIDAPEVSRFRHGEPLLQTGPTQVIEGERWVPVVGRDVGRRTVTGFVREDLIVSHPAGDKGPAGRVDSDLHRQGYLAIEVQPADTLRDICLRYGLSEDEIRDAIVLNRNHQIVDPDLIYPGDTVYLPHR